MGNWLVLALSLVFSGHAAVEDLSVMAIGHEYVELMSELERTAYAAGAYDAMAYQDEYRWMRACSKGWTETQLRAVLDKYFQDHPENWHYSAASMLPSAIGSVCRSAPEVCSE